MKTFAFVILSIAATLLLAQTHDTAAPALTAYTLTDQGGSPVSSVNATSASVIVVVTYTATDDLSGFRDIEVCYAIGQQKTCANDGNSTKGSLSYSGTLRLEIPRYAKAGTWNPQATLRDYAGNRAELGSDALGGFSAVLTVQ